MSTHQMDVLIAFDGQPEIVRCKWCMEVWQRPEWDEHSETLAIWARGHHRTDRPSAWEG
jgi:hypothetical protein